jgi:hypothetical protein
VGDSVTALDPTSGKPSTQAVQHVWINHDSDLIDLTLQRQVASEASKGQDAVTHRPHDETVHTNAKHPFLTKERGWVTVGQLTVGMHVVREDGTLAVVVGEETVPGAADMWNLTVSNLQTYAVGKVSSSSTIVGAKLSMAVPNSAKRFRKRDCWPMTGTAIMTQLS